MSRLWKYYEPTSATDPTPVMVLVSEAEILTLYYPYWCERMRRVGRGADISEQRCIEDWVTVHWASRCDACPPAAGKDKEEPS